MYSKRELLDLLPGTRIWIAVFLGGILAGALFYRQVYDLAFPLLKNAVAIAEKPLHEQHIRTGLPFISVFF